MQIQPEEAKAAGSAFAGLATFCATLWAVFSHSKKKQDMVEARFESKANQVDMIKALAHIEILYKNAEADRKLTRDLHDTAMTSIHSSTEQILLAIGRKK